MKKFCLAIAFTFFTLTSLLAAPSPYRFTLDLQNVQNDKVKVTLQTPSITTSEVVYNIPKMVPGTYSVDNFGRYVSEFKAYTKNGQLLKVEKLDDNRWKIKNATALNKLTYWIDDTFQDTAATHSIFEPTGTNIEANQNFLINTHGFMGYFDNLKRLSYEFTVLKPQNFYGSTALKTTKTSSDSDTFVVPTYMELVDSPLMYTVPDTTVLNIGGAEVLVSVYSPSKKVKANFIGATIRSTLEAQKNYLGGTLPVPRYAFLIYLSDKPNKTGAYGALEHSYSSVYYMPEADPERIAQQIVSIAAHEFFHIVTPLNIHAEQIHDFDYNNPQMSEHLWLYEGVTEYAATHVQVNQKILTPEVYLNKLRAYIIGANQYNDTLPFTVMSQGALDKYASQYGNVYQKGALIGLALDIKLRELSGGNYGMRRLMQDLALTYGKNKAFKDEELFDKITSLTYPEIRDFFRKYVEGSQPLPYTDIFKTVGVVYQPVSTEEKISLGRLELGYDGTAQKLTVENISETTAFSKKSKLQIGDQLITLNNKALTPETVSEIFKTEVYSKAPGEEITLLVGRANKRGKIKPKKLKGHLLKITEEKQNVLQIDPAANPQQKILRDTWLYSN
ncbi:M61 family metallopeptidase [Adhaeribacter radiodurans]|uniref:Peptidase M61 n=1 Tax=Adhaeribacter radiodurans TaxID=2745197 RepID=A0A7L7L4R5_9BACT|nr:peptidase M61 [Adhaeribacter radiodurans]QMU27798.1 peptidase M61 [Adhaeribacter radiodurans]